MTSNCATRDAYVESIQNYQDPTPTSARPSWLNASQCPGPRSGAAMTMNYNRANPAFENQVILFGGEGTSQSGNGVQGEVNILDVSAVSNDLSNTSGSRYKKVIGTHSKKS